MSSGNFLARCGAPDRCLDNSVSRARKALLPVISLAEAEEAMQPIFGGKTEDSRDSLCLTSSTCATSTADSYSCRTSTLRSSCEPLSSSVFIDGRGSDISASRGRRALLPVLSLAEAEKAIQPIFGGKLEDSDDSLGLMSTACSTSTDDSFSFLATPALRRPRFAEKRAEREAMSLAAPSDRLETSARRGIMSAIFAAKASDLFVEEKPRRGLMQVESMEGKLTSAFLFDTSRPTDFR